MEKVHGAESWKLSSDKVELNVTKVAGMATAAFFLGGRKVEPYSLAPWQPDEVDAGLPPLLKVLRGNFFCLPFGPQDDGPPHGDPANAEWTALAQDEASIELGLDCADSGARIEQSIRLKEGHSAIYYTYRISGLEGAWSYGTHPVIDCSGIEEGQARLSVSRFRWASVYQGMFSDPDQDERQGLMPAATFENLHTVPSAFAGTTDLSRYPSHQGFEDLVMMVNELSDAHRPFAWSAVVLDGYVWFSLKNPDDFPSTLFWLSNGGRDRAPWNGRHVGRIGIEEVCSHFSDSVERSREEALSGVRTVRQFNSEESVDLPMIQAVAPVPVDFDCVAEIVPAGDGRIAITSESGVTVEACIDWEMVC